VAVRIALMPQDVSMFHRSVQENVRYGRQEANDEGVMEAMVAAAASILSRNYPMACIRSWANVASNCLLVNGSALQSPGRF
jgi:ABC-type transport system involved in Fe-S cluster assembly fused permease/ATPase subunit